MSSTARVPTVPGLTGLTVLARGGYATVFRAMQESVGREVAVKVENRTLENDRDRRRFLREARAAGRMSSHPHVVDLFDAGVTTEGHPYLIMELCRGTYADRMRTVPLSPVEARDIGVKIADALADAHTLGVLHRDVKPANILISDFGEPALADFGLAILNESRDTSITLDVLTPAYAPPEMFRHTPPAPPADVYSLCATLYALMAGKPPRWPGNRDPSLVSLVDMFEQPIPDLPHVPRPLIDLLCRGMSNVAAERPTAAEMRDELLALVLGALPAQALPPALLTTDRSPDLGTATTVRRAGSPGGSGGSAAPGRPGRPGGSGGSGGPGGPGWPGGSGGSGPASPSSRSTYLGLGLGAALIAVLFAAIGLGLFLVREPVTTHFVLRTKPSSAPTCPLTPAGVARCVPAAECFDAVRVLAGVASAVKVGCAKPHLWEAFAQGRLPAGLDAATHARIKQNAEVRQVCSPANVRVLNADPGWQVEVLPPTREQLKAGERTYRCLAGRLPTRLTGSRFTR